MRKAIFLFITLITVLTIATVSRQGNSNFIYVGGSSASDLVFPHSGSQNPEGLDLSQTSRKGITVLLYRAVSDYSENSLCVSEEQFREEMEWLYQNKYHTLDTNEFYEVLVNGTPVADNSVVITFDAQSADYYQAAWPWLRQYGFKATFFIATEYINPRSIVWDQFNELANKGSFTGRRTLGRDVFSALTAQPNREQSENIEALYCPSGKFNRIILDDSETGYRLNIAVPGQVYLEENLLFLKQSRVREGMPISSFAKLMA